MSFGSGGINRGADGTTSIGSSATEINETVDLIRKGCVVAPGVLDPPVITSEGLIQSIEFRHL